MSETHRWRWGNVPIPEPHVIGLGAGLALQALVGWTIALPAWARGIGWLLAVGGLALIVWAVRAAARVPMARPDALILSGPYAWSRNPMYVGWTVVYLGVALGVGGGWALVLLPGVLAFTHVAVMYEERSLQDRFGEAYQAYRARVRRYL